MRRVLARPFLHHIRRMLLELRPVVAGEVAAYDLHPALGPFKNAAQLLMVVDNGLFQADDSAICIGQRHLTAFADGNLRRPRERSAQRRLHLIERMGPPAGDTPRLSAAIEIPPLHPPLVQIRMIRPQLRLVAPLIPIQPLRHRLFGLVVPTRRRQKFAHDHLLDLPQLPVRHQLAGVNVNRHRALLRAHLQHPFVVARGFHQRLPLLHSQRQRLFGVHIQTGLHGLHHDTRAGMRCGLHKHRVQLLLREHLAVIGVLRPVGAIGQNV